MSPQCATAGIDITSCVITMLATVRFSRLTRRITEGIELTFRDLLAQQNIFQMLLVKTASATVVAVVITLVTPVSAVSADTSN